MKYTIARMVVTFFLVILVACGVSENREIGKDTEAAVAASTQTPLSGERLYRHNCATCHEGGLPKAPHRDWLAKMAPDAVLHSLTDGIMQRFGDALRAEEKVEITEYLTGVNPADYSLPPGPEVCAGPELEFDQTRPASKSGWGYDTRRFVPSESARLSKSDVPQLALKWAMAFPGAVRARSLPVVAMGSIFVGSQNGTVYALDFESGCARWEHLRRSSIILRKKLGRYDAETSAGLRDLCQRIIAVKIRP